MSILANNPKSPAGIQLARQQFLMTLPNSGGGRLHVVLNWFEELKRLVPTGR